MQRAVGHYRLKSLIGRGGTSEVYAAEHAVLGDTVAVKLLRPELAADAAQVRALVDEGTKVRAIDHPNVVRVLDAGIDADTHGCYLVMEHVAGEPLSARLRRGPLDEAEVRRLGAQLADGVAAAHACGIVHRDLKPANVMLDGERPKIVDFGIAKHLGARSAVTTGRMVGTLAYMAPEQLASGMIAPCTDVWALGVILFEALTGRLPFAAFDDGRCAQLVDEPARASSLVAVTPELDAILARCLARDPAGRPTAGELAALLRGERVVDEERITVDAGPIAGAAAVAPIAPAAAAAPVAPAPPRRRGRRHAIVGAAAAAAIGMVVVVLALRPGTDATASGAPAAPATPLASATSATRTAGTAADTANATATGPGNATATANATGPATAPGNPTNANATGAADGHATANATTTDPSNSAATGTATGPAHTGPANATAMRPATATTTMTTTRNATGHGNTTGATGPASTNATATSATTATSTAPGGPATAGSARSSAVDARLTIQVRSVPPGARVLVDGKPRGITPVELAVELPETIVVERTGYRPARVRVDAAGAVDVKLRRRRAPRRHRETLD